MGLLDDIRSSLGGANEAETSERKQESFKTGLCPDCTETLRVSPGEIVKCPNCGAKADVNNLRPLSNASFQADPAVQATIAAVTSMEGVDDAVVFLKNFFDNYDWEAYAESTIVLIPEVEAMVESVKIKSGSKPAVWSLDFDSVSVPLSKKIAGLVAAEKKMEELYSDIDNTDLLETFDFYKATIDAIVEDREKFIKRMTLAVQNAEELGLDKAKVTAIKDELKKLSTILNSLKVVKDITEVDALKKAREAADKKLIAQFAEKGIDAVSTYAAAIDAFNGGRGNWKRALDLFISIRGYAESKKYISKIDKYFVYGNELVFVSGKPFVLREKTVAPETLDAGDTGAKDKKAKKGFSFKKAKDVAEEEDFAGPTLELVPLVEKEPAKEAVVKDITKLLTVYATDLFFIKKNKELCVYNTESGEEKVIDTFKANAYNTEKLWFNNDGDKLYMRKKLDLKKEKLGCFKSLFKKPEFIVHVNNYSLVEINLSKGELNTLVPELVDIYEFNAKNLFYMHAEESTRPVRGGKKNETEKVIINRLMVVNMKTGESKWVLSPECDIHKIVDSKVIYSYHTPNEWNKELHVYDLADETDCLIEENVYSFVDVIKGKVYYKVGNAKFCPLFSNSFTGNDRVEIAANIGSILAIRGSWIYLLRGTGYNQLLSKISADGKRKVNLCTAFEKIVKVTDSYIFYVNCFSELCSVRFDGKENKVIASDIDANNIVVEKSAFFYLRKEPVAINKRAYSLYTMDAEGKNVRKLAFDVLRMQNYDEDKLFISKKEKAYFEITIPEQKGKSHVEKISRILTKVIEYNKKTRMFTDVRVEGLPSKGEYEFKKGCFGGKEKVSSTYKQVRGPITYMRNIDNAGSVFNAQVKDAKAEEAKAAQAKADAKANKKNNLGCLSAGKNSSKSGCLRK